MHPHTPTLPLSDNSAHCGEIYPEVIGNLLIRIPTRRMSRNDGCVSIWGLSLDFGQRWRAALREGDLHVVLACLELRLHAVHKLLIA